MDSAVIISKVRQYNIEQILLILLNLCCRNVQFSELLRVHFSLLSHFRLHVY